MKLNSFCRFISARVMETQSSVIVSYLLPLLQLTTNETLYLLLETLRSVISLDRKVLTVESTPMLVLPVYDLWLKYSSGLCNL